MFTFLKPKNISRSFVYRIEEERYVDKQTEASTEYAKKQADKLAKKVAKVKEASGLEFKVLYNKVKSVLPGRGDLTAAERFTVPPGYSKTKGVTNILQDEFFEDVFKNPRLLMLTYSYMMKQDKIKGTDINVIKQGDIIDVNKGTLSIKRGEETFEWDLFPFEEDRLEEAEEEAGDDDAGSPFGKITISREEPGAGVPKLETKGRNARDAVLGDDAKASVDEGNTKRFQDKVAKADEKLKNLASRSESEIEESKKIRTAIEAAINEHVGGCRLLNVAESSKIDFVNSKLESFDPGADQLVYEVISGADGKTPMYFSIDIDGDVDEAITRARLLKQRIKKGDGKTPVGVYVSRGQKATFDSSGAFIENAKAGAKNDLDRAMDDAAERAEEDRRTREKKR